MPWVKLEHLRQWQPAEGNSSMKNEKVWRCFLRLKHLLALEGDEFGPTYSPAKAGLRYLTFNYTFSGQIIQQKMDSLPVSQVQNVRVNLTLFSLKPNSTDSIIDLYLPWVPSWLGRRHSLRWLILCVTFSAPQCARYLTKRYSRCVCESILDNMIIWIGRLSKADPPQCGCASSSPLKAWIEQKG